MRPRARRAARTLRPPGVAERERKPWRRLRTRLLGWKVRFIGRVLGTSNAKGPPNVRQPRWRADRQTGARSQSGTAIAGASRAIRRLALGRRRPQSIQPPSRGQRRSSADIDAFRPGRGLEHQREPRRRTRTRRPARAGCRPGSPRRSAASRARTGCRHRMAPALALRRLAPLSIGPHVIGELDSGRRPIVQCFAAGQPAPPRLG